MQPFNLRFLSSLSLACLIGCNDASQPDLILNHGVIYTLDPGRSVQEAVVITDGRISFVGSSAEALAQAGSKTQVVDLGGRLVLPGLQDTHIHPIMGGIDALSCDLSVGETAEDYLALIETYAQANPDLAWITGGGWAMSAFGPGGMPAKELLDAVVPDRPVLLFSSDGHTAWANSKALALAGLTAETPDPPDGRIDRHPETGELIGSLQEGAGNLLDHVVPAVTPEAALDGLRYSVAMLNAYGITAVQDAIVTAEDLETYHALEALGELSLHVEASLWWERERGLEQVADLIALREPYREGQVRANTVKIMQDGVMENYTAVMLEPYLLDTDNVTGIPMVEPALLKDVVTALDAAQFQVHFHAIGDGAIRQALDAIQAAKTSNGLTDGRHHISHLQIIDRADIPRFAELGVTANFQPLWAYADEYINDLTLPFIRAETAQQMYPIQSVIDAGGTVAFGSDWSVSTANPWVQIEVAITRKNPEGPEEAPGEAFLPHERVSLEAALEAFTIHAASVNHREDETGSIEAGKLADLVVLDRNLFEIPAAEISETAALVTLFKGEVAHGSLALPGESP